MSWFKLDENLPDHPKLKLLEELLDDDDAIARLAFLWCWCLRFAPDGNLGKFTPRMITKAARYHGDPNKFYSAMVEAGFIDEGEGGSVVHDWDEWQGGLVERIHLRDAYKETEKELSSDGYWVGKITRKLDSYSEKLKDFRWRALRKRVIASANGRCAICEAATKKFEIHHKAYRKGAEPWEYEDSELMALCPECHDQQTSTIRAKKRLKKA